MRHSRTNERMDGTEFIGHCRLQSLGAPVDLFWKRGGGWLVTVVTPPPPPLDPPLACVHVCVHMCMHVAGWFPSLVSLPYFLTCFLIKLGMYTLN